GHVTGVQTCALPIFRFQSSYHQAVRAYARAFELAPALHRSFQAGGYQRLRDLLYTDVGFLREGVALAPDSGHFYAYPTWSGDSLLLLPYREQLITRGLVHANMLGVREAARHEREVFARIAHAWAAGLPNNAGTKEAVAISLDML